VKDDILSRAHRVTQPRSAAAFSDPLRRRLVLLLAGRERSVGQMAETTGVDIRRLHYHVTALRKLGLIKVARVQRRAGRPIKLYRAVADAFFVSDDIAPSSPSAALNDELRRSLAKLRDPARHGVLYRLGDDGEPRMQPVRGSGSGGAPSAEQWRVLRLTRADALRLAEKIERCLGEFAGRDGAAKAYLVHFAMAPRAIG